MAAAAAAVPATVLFTIMARQLYMHAHVGLPRVAAVLIYC